MSGRNSVCSIIPLPLVAGAIASPPEQTSQPVPGPPVEDAQLKPSTSPIRMRSNGAVLADAERTVAAETVERNLRTLFLIRPTKTRRFNLLPKSWARIVSK